MILLAEPTLFFVGGNDQRSGSCRTAERRLVGFF